MVVIITYDHRLRRIGHPVRSAIHKPQIGRLVVGWVTTSEYLLLYVFFQSFFVPRLEKTFWRLRKNMPRNAGSSVPGRLLGFLYFSFELFFGSSIEIFKSVRGD